MRIIAHLDMDGRKNPSGKPIRLVGIRVEKLS